MNGYMEYMDVDSMYVYLCEKALYYKHHAMEEWK
jgi:hypothetical protein